MNKAKQINFTKGRKIYHAFKKITNEYYAQRSANPKTKFYIAIFNTTEKFFDCIHYASGVTQLAMNFYTLPKKPAFDSLLPVLFLMDG